MQGNHPIFYQGELLSWIWWRRVFFMWSRAGDDSCNKKKKGCVWCCCTELCSHTMKHERIQQSPATSLSPLLQCSGAVPSWCLQDNSYQQLLFYLFNLCMWNTQVPNLTCSSFYLRLSHVFSRSHKQIGQNKHICRQKVSTGSKMQKELLSNLGHLGYELSNIKISNHVRGDRNHIHRNCCWEKDAQTCH